MDESYSVSKQFCHGRLLPDRLGRLKGYKIRYKTDEGEWEGDVGMLWPRRHKVTIENVFSVSDNLFYGSLNFFLDEIKSFCVVSGPRLKKEDAYQSSPYNSCDATVFDDLLEEESNHSEKVYYEDFIEQEFILKLPKAFCGKLPTDSVILRSIDKEFQQALQYISRQSMIGVAFEGSKVIDRYGNLNWICISTPSCTFLFNIKYLKAESFDRGLRKIFHNGNIEKIMHDCRGPADCLFHQFSTEIVNVFDTQVADLIVNIQNSKGKKMFDHVNDLDTCLFYHLEIPNEFLYRRKESFANLSCINEDLQNFLIKSGIYLRALRKKLFKLLHSPFHRAVEIYLNVIKNASEKELLLDISHPNKVPLALCLEGLQIVSFKEFVDVPLHISSGPPYRESKGLLSFLYRVLHKHATDSPDNEISTSNKVCGNYYNSASVKKLENSIFEHHDEIGSGKEEECYLKSVNLSEIDREYEKQMKLLHHDDNIFQACSEVKSKKLEKDQCQTIIDWSKLNAFSSPADTPSLDSFKLIPAGME